MQIILQENEDFPLMSSNKLSFGLIFEEAAIVRLLLIYRLLLLGYVFFVCHNITQIRPASLVKMEG